MRSHGGVIARLSELIAELPDDTDADTLIGLRRVIDQAEAKFCRQVRAFDTRQGYEACDPSAAGMQPWLRHYCHLAPGEAARRVRIARTLPELPDTQAAFDTGDITLTHVDEVCLLARKVTVAAVREVEPSLLGLAKAEHPGVLKVATSQIRHWLDPDGALKDANRQADQNYLRVCSTFAGTVVLDGQFDPETGAVIMTALDSLTGPTTPGDQRGRQQRQAAALGEICHYLLDADVLPTRGRRRPHLNLTVSLETLLGMRPSLPAELDYANVPVPAATAQRLACDPELTRIVLGPRSEILDVGRTRRLATPAQDLAVRQRDKTCRWETCDRPAHMCHLHHVIPWWQGGPTDKDNLILLCQHHHRLVHEGQQPLRLRQPPAPLRT